MTAASSFSVRELEWKTSGTSYPTAPLTVSNAANGNGEKIADLSTLLLIGITINYMIK